MPCSESFYMTLLSVVVCMKVILCHSTCTSWFDFSSFQVYLTDYWPSNVRVCGFWFIPIEWQFSCQQCLEVAALDLEEHSRTECSTCSVHVQLHSFLKTDTSMPLVFVGLSSIGRQVLFSLPLPLSLCTDGKK